MKEISVRRMEGSMTNTLVNTKVKCTNPEILTARTKKTTVKKYDYRKTATVSFWTSATSKNFLLLQLALQT